MVWQEMGCRWTTYGMKLACVTLLILVLEIQGHSSLNSEGLALLSFQARVTSDPFGALVNWNPHESDHCMWSGVKCVGHKVQILDLNGCSLEGTLAPELGNLTYLRTLILSNNHFSGVIPKQFGQLSALEVLDLRNNNLYGTIPVEIGGLLLLKRLLLCNNNFEGGIPLEVGNLDLLTEVQFDANLTPPLTEITCLNRKIVQCEWQSSFNLLRKADSIFTPIRGTINRYFNVFPIRGWTDKIDSYDSVPSSPKSHIIQHVRNAIEISRRKLGEQSSNLQAMPVNGGAQLNQIYHPSSRSSGSFPAVPIIKNVFPPPPPPPASISVPTHPPTHNTSGPHGQTSTVSQKDTPASGNSGHVWKYIVGISGGIFLIIFAFVLLFMCKSRAARSIGPWKTGLSGQLQNAFVKGVPNLNRVELETACEDFSNIIETNDEVIMYKGTLSSGTEIAVVSTTITSIKDWSKRSEMIFRKKINTMSRVNHKNFVNLIGFCEEDESFSRMMVFEYAPNGTLSEHLHVKEVEHLDWSARMRIIMGVAYCLQYMHNQNPPIPHSNVNSKVIYLTDDYAAKLAEACFWADFLPNSPASNENDKEGSHELPPPTDIETNVYDFGILLLELISGKPPYSEEQGLLINWGSEYLNDKRSISYLIDPSLKSFKDNELAIICEVIQECVQSDARKRPTMEEIISKLRVVLDISPESAIPRLSPLWWAELEILSAEAA